MHYQKCNYNGTARQYAIRDDSRLLI